MMSTTTRMTWTRRLSPYLTATAIAAGGLLVHTSTSAQDQSSTRRSPPPAEVEKRDDKPITAAVPTDMKGFTQTIPGSLVEFEMVPVPGGEGIEPFYMGKHEVTWDEFAYWAYVRDVEKEIDKIKARARKLRPSPPYDEVDRGFGFKDRPALGMSRQSAELYAEWLSEKTGRRYRLPTRAEWEHAFKLGQGGTLTPEMTGEELAEYAWFEGNSQGSTQAPGTRQANTLGIHDMLGNVAEWVTDTGEQRIAVGGHFRSPPEQTTAQSMEVEDESWNENYPNEPKSIWWFVDADYVGFRLVCEPGEPKAATEGEQPPANVKE